MLHENSDLTIQRWWAGVLDTDPGHRVLLATGRSERGNHCISVATRPSNGVRLPGGAPLVKSTTTDLQAAAGDFEALRWLLLRSGFASNYDPPTLALRDALESDQLPFADLSLDRVLSGAHTMREVSAARFRTLLGSRRYRVLQAPPCHTRRLVLVVSHNDAELYDYRTNDADVDDWSQDESDYLDPLFKGLARKPIRERPRMMIDLVLGLPGQPIRWALDILAYDGAAPPRQTDLRRALLAQALDELDLATELLDLLPEYSDNALDTYHSDGEPADVEGLSNLALLPARTAPGPALLLVRDDE